MKSNHELDDRKMKILQTIIKTYLETGDPVGSRTISKYTDLNLSSATIRNEMADLEELGYIMQPHTSAGRIPSDKGYRLYVDMLMEEKRAGSYRDEGTDACEGRQDGSAFKAGSEGSGNEHELRNDDFCSDI